ncbi:MAG: UvrD/REP helicase [Edaphobacter sp.]|nr:UvrD/REP helicase [Edaphobacter sp.]
MADLFVVHPAEGMESIAKSLRPPDWEARRLALDVRQSWIVEAPAGSGKTGLLIQRYLKLLADESVSEPEQVLAITFTRKATSEIRDRVVAQLEGAMRNEPLKNDSDFERQTRTLAESVLQRDRMLGWGLLENPRRLKMQTIDSVCAEIARSLPVLSGGGGQVPVEDATDLYREAARQTLLQLGGEDQTLNAALRTVLLHRDGNLRDCKRLLTEMLALRDQWGELVPLGRRDLDDAYLDGVVLPRLERALEQAVCSGLTRFAAAIPGDILHELAQLAGEMGHAVGFKGNSPIAICAGLDRLPGETAEHLAHWRALIHLLTTKETKWRSRAARSDLGFEIEKRHSEQLKRLFERLHGQDDLLQAIKRVKHLPPAAYPQEQWVVAKALFRVLNRALAELQLVFAQRGECDFAELGLLAKGALRREGAVDDLAAALGMKLQHLLVDEMQDTSTSQYELIQLLTQGWDGQSQTVFLVGDPKQSIYLFRQARVERFVRTMVAEQLGDLPVGCLRLTANFRSQSQLVDAFNEDFSLLFSTNANAANPDEVPYVPAIAVNGPSRIEGTVLGVVWHANVMPAELSTDESKHARRQQAKLDAQRVREVVKQWRARPLPEGRNEPWKIAVLVRSRNHLLDIVAALKQDGGEGAIPFRAVEIEALGERQEVLDLFALTRALLHPADRVAWLAVLHAPWCGLGLAELHLLAGADDPAWAERSIEDVIEERGHLLSEESCERLQRLWTVLRAAAGQRSRLTAAQWVERTWRSLGGDAYLTAEELVNARRYLQLLDEVEEQSGTLDLKLLKRRLGKLYAEPAASPDAVDLMTIHGAKGLEWDVVIVPALHKTAKVTSSRLLTWSEIESGYEAGGEAVAHVVLAPITGKGEGSRELNDWLKSIHSAREAAERRRLFYVACTRAREELHLFASPDARADGAVSLAAGSLLGAAWPAAESHFTEAAAQAPEALAKVFIMPAAASVEEEYVGQLAAGGDDAVQIPMLQRLPVGFNPLARFETARRLPYGDTGMESQAVHLERPEGSFEARAFGNTVHAFLEALAKSLGEGVAADTLLRELASWNPRIETVLRGDGLPPASVQRLAPKVRTALESALRDAEGLWVLRAHDDAASEYALTSWTASRSSVRLDRVFRAGTAPLAAGTDCLWIVDYKTTMHGSEGIDEFMGKERAKYVAQMEAYARIMKGAMQIRVGLYYPMLPKLIWWTPESD